MKFKVTRTSDWSRTQVPCAGATQVGDHEWEMEVSDLNELMKIVGENGKIVLWKNEIEIYDEDRE